MLFLLFFFNALPQDLLYCKATNKCKICTMSFWMHLIYLFKRQHSSISSLKPLTQLSPKFYETHAFLRIFSNVQVLMQGPLLDFGRNPILFPCAWLYRQGFLTPWARDRFQFLHEISGIVSYTFVILE